jgi:hypothetical protein
VTSRRRSTAIALGLAAATLLPVAPATAAPGGPSVVRSATAAFHDISTATDAGFGLLTDAAGIACIDKAGEGGMGIHYVNGARVGDPTENADAPELLVYEPEKNGTLRLVAVEYDVVKSAWEGAGNTAPPSLFGQPFELVRAGNRYGLPDFYELHAWIWKHNPAGMFEDWNPDVTCP